MRYSLAFYRSWRKLPIVLIFRENESATTESYYGYHHRYGCRLIGGQVMIIVTTKYI